MSMPAYDRPRLLAALSRLGAEDDETVLEAARSAAALIEGANVGWDDLLREASPILPVAAGDAPPADDAARIAALLALPELSTDARESLAEIAADLARGDIREEDRTYVAGLYGRLIA